MNMAFHQEREILLLNGFNLNQIAPQDKFDEEFKDDQTDKEISIILSSPCKYASSDE